MMDGCLIICCSYMVRIFYFPATQTAVRFVYLFRHFNNKEKWITFFFVKVFEKEYIRTWSCFLGEQSKLILPSILSSFYLFEKALKKGAYKSLHILVMTYTCNILLSIHYNLQIYFLRLFRFVCNSLVSGKGQRSRRLVGPRANQMEDFNSR